MDSLIGKLESLQFNEYINKNKQNELNSKMNKLINKLHNLDMNKNEIINNITSEINKFIIEIQKSIYWKFKIKNQQKKFEKLKYKQSVERIINILTFYHSKNEIKLNIFDIFKFINDEGINLLNNIKIDYNNIINKNIISNNNIINMKNEFFLIKDFILQNISKCNIKKCIIYKRYSFNNDNNDDDDLLMNDNLKYFIKIMDIIHCFLFHSDECGIIKNKNNIGQWYWLNNDYYNKNDIKWIPYKLKDQKELDYAWLNMKKYALICSNTYQVVFDRVNSIKNKIINPSGWQYNHLHKTNNPRPVIHGIMNKNGLLNGIKCDTLPK